MIKKSKKSKNDKTFGSRNLTKKLIIWSLIIFLIKIVFIFNIQQAYVSLPTSDKILIGGIWLGADAENYISAYLFMSNEGWFSNNRLLHYWPAGYSFLLLVLSEINRELMFYILSILQHSSIHDFQQSFHKHLHQN